jgi:hypothetical protein
VQQVAMSRRVAAIAGLLVACASANEARANDEEPRSDRWADMPDAIEIHAGLGTPVGFLGLVYDRVLWRRWSASAGFGAGSAREGGSLHLAAGTRFRVIQQDERGTGIYIGIDYSTGGYRLTPMPVVGLSKSSMSRPTIVYSDRVHWLQGSVGYEVRSASGGIFRPYLGLAFMLNPDSRRCIYEISETPCEVQRRGYEGDTIMVLGIAVGGAR